MIIKGKTLTKPLLKDLLEGNSYGVGENSLYPKNKQNLKAATSFHLAFIHSKKKTDLPYSLTSIKLELMLLGEVFSGLLSFFVFTDVSIADQINQFRQQLTHFTTFMENTKCQ